MAGTGELGNAMLRADGQTRPVIQREAERPSEESHALAVSSAWAVQRGADRAKRIPRDSSPAARNDRGEIEGGRERRTMCDV